MKHPVMQKDEKNVKQCVIYLNTEIESEIKILILNDKVL